MLNDNHNGKVILGGEYDLEKKWIQPTIILNPDDDSRIMNEEIFGPLFPIKLYSDF